MKQIGAHTRLSIIAMSFASTVCNFFWVTLPSTPYTSELIFIYFAAKLCYRMTFCSVLKHLSERPAKLSTKHVT